MRIEAPIPYIRICPSTISVQDTHFTRSLNDTRQLVFCDYMHNNFVGEKCTPFLNCVITGQYMEYILGPEVSTTPESGFFAVKLKSNKVFT